MTRYICTRLLGVTLCELVTGTHPFSGSTEVATFAKISSLGTSAMPGLTFSLSIPEQLSSLIGQLVVGDPKKRLGSAGNLSELKSHAFFNTIDWKKIATPGNLSPLLSLAAAEAVITAGSALDTDLKAAWNSVYTGSEEAWES